MPVPSITPDINGKLNESGLVTSTAAWLVDGTAKVFDLGAAVYTPFDVLIKLLAVEIASNDELYRLFIQGSSSSTFASTIVQLGGIEFGANEVLVGSDQDTTTGDYLLRCHNEFDGTVYRYIRGYTVISGTIATGISHEAWISAVT